MEATLNATHDDGRELHFIDFVEEGAEVDLFKDPDEERGYPFDEVNTYIDPSRGARRCRACTAERARKYYRDALGAA